MSHCLPKVGISTFGPFNAIAHQSVRTVIVTTLEQIHKHIREAHTQDN